MSSYAKSSKTLRQFGMILWKIPQLGSIGKSWSKQFWRVVTYQTCANEGPPGFDKGHSLIKKRLANRACWKCPRPNQKGVMCLKNCGGFGLKGAGFFRVIERRATNLMQFWDTNHLPTALPIFQWISICLFASSLDYAENVNPWMTAPYSKIVVTPREQTKVYLESRQFTVLLWLLSKV